MTVPTLEQLTQEELKKILHYNPETGVFTFTKNGKQAGTRRINSGKTYIIITIRSKKYRAHRLAFLYMTGSMPADLVDHINGDGVDNRWCNLREVDAVNNNRNMRLRDDNTSGVTGVHWNKKDQRWQVSIKTDKHSRGYIGQFKTLIDAVAARYRVEIEHGFHPNHGQVRPL